MVAAALDPNYWKDPYEIKAKFTPTLDNMPHLSPLFSLRSPTPEPNPELVLPPARKALRKSSNNNNFDNSLEFGPGHPTTFSAGVCGARGAWNVCKACQG